MKSCGGVKPTVPRRSLDVEAVCLLKGAGKWMDSQKMFFKSTTKVSRASNPNLKDRAAEGRYCETDRSIN